MSQRWPILALAAKLVGNAWNLIAVGLKTIKVGPAVLSFGVFAVIFSWEFAAMILLMIGIHECGHVYAMWRCGIPVRGIYFIPLLGGAAVSQGLAKTRWGNAFIQINGPIYGTVLAGLCLAAFYLTGEQVVLLATAAGWGALINLFNLLPIMPLDGGRLLGEISHSLHHAAGRYAVLGSLVLGAVAAYLFGLGLLWIMVVVGLLEFGRQLGAATRKALMDRLGQHRPVSFEVDEYFGQLTRPLTHRGTDKQRKQARAAFDMLLTEAQMIPMRPWQTATVTAGYLSLAVVLVLIAWTVSHIDGAEHAFELLK
jgi:Zn-dependent protease